MSQFTSFVVLQALSDSHPCSYVAGVSGQARTCRRNLESGSRIASSLFKGENITMCNKKISIKWDDRLHNFKKLSDFMEEKSHAAPTGLRHWIACCKTALTPCYTSLFTWNLLKCNSETILSFCWSCPVFKRCEDASFKNCSMQFFFFFL